MALWFVATAVLSVYWVFGDARFDYRWLIVGAVLPDVLDGLGGGGAGVFHSLTGSVAMLVVVMLATIGRRPVRKRLLGIPIGMLLHLVFDGAFADTAVFWWPFTGDLPDVALPSIARGWWNVPLEVAGALAIAWMWRRFGLADRELRRRWLRTGVLVPVR